MSSSKSSSSSSKDYSSSLAGLQASYGFGGSPVIPTSSPSPTTSKPTLKSSRKYSPKPSSFVAPSPKNFSDALANLQTSYGFGRSPLIPTLPSSPESKTKKSPSLFKISSQLSSTSSSSSLSKSSISSFSSLKSLLHSRSRRTRRFVAESDHTLFPTVAYNRAI